MGDKLTACCLLAPQMLLAPSYWGQVVTDSHGCVVNFFLQVFLLLLVVTWVCEFACHFDEFLMMLFF